MLTRRIRALGSAALLVALLGVPASASAATRSPDGGSAERSVPSANAVRKVALGVSMHPDISRDLPTYLAYKHEMGRAPAMWSMWSNWGDPASGPFPKEPIMAQLKADKVTPVIIWQPDGGSAHDKAVGKYSRYNLIAGYRNPSGTKVKPQYDTYIRQFARDAKAFGGAVLLRFAHEFDGATWFPWCIGRFDNTAANFVKAWRHIWTLFQQEGATNVRFYWTPLGGGKTKPTMFPGSTYVSYMGFSAFNWDDGAHGGWLSMRDAYKKRYNRLRGISSKPIIVGESGSAPGTGTGARNKNNWIRDGYAAVYAQMTQIKGIVYFNVDMRGGNPPQPDWRITGVGSVGGGAYKLVVEQTRFKGAIN